MKTPPRKTLGVLGGMGPAATVDFLAKLQAATPAASDEDHVRVVMDLNPRVPNRHLDGERARADLSEMAARLRAAGAEVLAMPCNTAHVAAAAIEAASALELIDMPGAATAEAAAGGARRIGVLCTPLALTLYRERLDRAGLAAVTLSPESEAALMDAIYRVKAGDLGPGTRAIMAACAAELVAAGAEAVVMGCSEVPLALGRADVPLVDATEALARACVRACGAEARP